MGDRINYGEEAKKAGLDAQHIEQQPRTEDDQRKLAWDLELEEFRNEYSGGAREFFACLWARPDPHQLEAYGRMAGASMDGRGDHGTAPAADAEPLDIVEGLEDGVIEPRHVAAEMVAGVIRAIGIERWLNRWEYIVKQHGVEALPLAERVHAEEARRSDNQVRAAVIDLAGADDAPPVPMLVDDLIPLGVPCAGVGRNESGKSLLLATDLACSVATGTPWLGHKVRQGRVLVIAAEDTEAEILVRFDAWRREHPKAGDPADSLDVSVRMIGLVAKPVTETYESRTTGEEQSFTRAATGPSRDVQQLVEMIAEEQPILVVIDNLQACMDGHSNMSESDIGSVLNAMHRMVAAAGCTVLMVAHTNQGDTSVKGLTTFEDRMNMVLHVKAIGKADQRVILPYKNRSTVKFKPIKFHLVASGNSVVVAPLTNGDIDTIHAAMKQLGVPSSKNAILEQVQTAGAGIKRGPALRLISDLADDEDDPVEQVGTKFALVGWDDD